MDIESKFTTVHFGTFLILLQFNVIKHTYVYYVVFVVQRIQRTKMVDAEMNLKAILS